jgi:hypothetical protein
MKPATPRHTVGLGHRLRPKEHDGSSDRQASPNSCCSLAFLLILLRMFVAEPDVRHLASFLHFCLRSVQRVIDSFNWRKLTSPYKPILSLRHDAEMLLVADVSTDASQSTRPSLIQRLTLVCSYKSRIATSRPFRVQRLSTESSSSQPTCPSPPPPPQPAATKMAPSSSIDMEKWTGSACFDSRSGCLFVMFLSREILRCLYNRIPLRLLQL